MQISGESYLNTIESNNLQSSLHNLHKTLESLNVSIPLSSHHLGVPNSSQLPPNLDTFIQLYSDSLSEAREHYRDQVSLKSLWLFLNKLRWNYPDNLFDTIKSDDIIEVYTAQHIQVFRSYLFFQHCSYSLTELLTKPWFELFRKDPEIEKESFTLVERVLNGGINGVIPMPLNSYWVHEVQSEDPFQIYIQPRHCCMITNNQNHIEGYLASYKILKSTRQS